MQNRLSIIIIAVTLACSILGVAEDSPIISKQISEDNSPTAIATARKQGAETAAKDIKNGTFRILKRSSKPSTEGETLVDRRTGYRVLIVGGCNVTAPFIAEIAAYNSAMQQWHAKEILKATQK